MLDLRVKWRLLTVAQWMGWSLESREEAVLALEPAVARFELDQRAQGRQQLWVGCGGPGRRRGHLASLGLWLC